MTAREAERCALGAMLLDHEAALQARRGLSADMFEAEQNRRVFKAMAELLDDGLTADPPLLMDKLGDGSSEILCDLMDAVPTAANLPYHIRAVREAFQRRQLLQTAREIEVHAESGDISDVLSRTTERLSQIRGHSTSKLRILTDEEIASLPKPEWLWDNRIPMMALAVIYGPPGTGKSFIALQLAMSVGTGFRALGESVYSGSVVIVAPEGATGLGARVRAWREHNNYHGKAHVHFIPATVSLLEPSEVDELINAIRELDPVLVIFDTLARSLPGGDENSAQDMGRAIASADRVRDELRATTVLVHHTNAGGERERGSTALRGAADTMIQVQSKDGRIAMSCEKQKDAPPFSKMDLSLLPVLDSAVVTPISEWELSADELTPTNYKILRSLSRDFLDDGASATAWMEAAEVANSTFYRARTWLVTNGYADQKKAGNGARYTLTDKGRESLTPNSQATPKALPESTPDQLPPTVSLLGDGDDGSTGTEGDGKNGKERAA